MALTNPVATLGFNIPSTSPDIIEVDRWEMVLFANDPVQSYKRNQPETEPFSTSELPSGNRCNYFHRLGSIETSPTGIPFVGASLWGDTDGFFRNVPSGFISGNNTVMPKLIIPTDSIVDNGVLGDPLLTAKFGNTPDKLLFNWEVFTEGATVAVTGDERKKYIDLGGTAPKSVTFKWKSESASDSKIYTRLSQLGTANPPSVDLWKPEELVLGGAFCLYVNVVPSVLGTASPEDEGKNKWEVKFSFGEVVMTLCDAGTMLVSIADNQTKVQLTEAAASENAPHGSSVKGVKKYIITIYPVWNGLVVSSGVQDSDNVREVSSTFCPKSKGKTPWVAPYENPAFDGQDPKPIEFEYAGHSEVVVDFGVELKINISNCRMDLAYMPCFFSKKMVMDCIFVSSKDTDSVGYSYRQQIFPIWTKGGNGEAVLKVNDSTSIGDWVAQPLPSELGGPLDYPDSEGTLEYRYVRFSLEMGESEPLPYCRYAPELLGFYMKNVQADESNAISNPNSVAGDPFNVTWTGGDAGDPQYTGSWQDYIQNISVTLGLDGSSATITLDKYGCAGWDALVKQKIGAITIDISGGAFPSRGGRIFSGLAFGVGATGSADSNTWTIQCQGLEKKMQEIALILPPYFDGMSVDDVTKFLCRYAGIRRNFDNFGSPSQSNVNVGGSSRPESPKYNFATGSEVSTVLTEVMNNSLVTWICQPDGYCHFYALDEDTNMPKQPHTDYSSSYPTSHVITVDQSPDFEDLRNEIVVIALRAMSSDGMLPDMQPVMPHMKMLDNRGTTPEIPWSRSMVFPVKGILTDAQLEIAANRVKTSASRYEILGKTQITGDARIWPYSAWGTGVVVYSVTHNIDFVNKTWTTDLEFSKSGK